MTVQPRWFERAVANEPSSSRIGVDGRSVHYVTWGEVGADPIILVHGNGAHARWWSFVAPFLAARGKYVGAVDLGGMGESDDWPEPSIDDFVHQICAVAEQIGMGRPVTLVGHSFGGLVSAAAAILNPHLISRLAVIDSPFHIGSRTSHRTPRSANAVYSNRGEILSRFRLIPAQEIEYPRVLDFIAQHSITSAAGGWTWKFRIDPWDSPLMQKSLWTDIGQQLRSFPGPTGYLRGELSELCPLEVEAVWRRFNGDNAPVIVIPDARHHVILDQPLAVVTALETLFALPSWSVRQNASPDAATPISPVTAMVEGN